MGFMDNEILLPILQRHIKTSKSQLISDTTDNKINEDDIIFENVLIDKSSFVFVEGSMLDFSEKLIENTFKIINPKATSSCGCGSSFSV